MSHEAVSPGPSAPSSAAGPAAPADLIASGGAHVGLELGSTRIKAALIDEHGTVLATGAHPWENSYIDGNWTYALDEVRSEEHTSELQSRGHLVCRLLLEKKNKMNTKIRQ